MVVVAAPFPSFVLHIGGMRGAGGPLGGVSHPIFAPAAGTVTIYIARPAIVLKWRLRQAASSGARGFPSAAETSCTVAGFSAPAIVPDIADAIELTKIAFVASVPSVPRGISLGCICSKIGLTRAAARAFVAAVVVIGMFSVNHAGATVL